MPTAIQQTLRERAEREIALAEATGARAHAAPDYRVVFVTRRDGTVEKVPIRAPDKSKAH